MSNKTISISEGVTRMKPLHTTWITTVYKSLIDKKENIINGFISVGIQQAVLTPEEYSRDPNPFRQQLSTPAQ